MKSETKMTSKQQWRQTYRKNGQYAQVHPCYCCGKSAGIDYFSHPLTDTGNWDDAALCLCERCFRATEHMTDVAQYLAFSKFVQQRTGRATRKMATEIFSPNPNESVSLSGADSAQEKGSKTMSRKTPRAQSSLTHIEGVEIEEIEETEGQEPEGAPAKKKRAAKAPRGEKAADKKPAAQKAPPVLTVAAARKIELVKQILGFKNLRLSHARAIAKLDPKSDKAMLLKARIWHREVCLAALEGELAALGF